MSINGFTSPVQRAIHFRKHRHEFGNRFATATDYEAAAIAFFVCTKTKSMIDCTRSRGDYVLYDRATNTMGICSPNGMLRTLYRPDKMKHKQKTHLVHFRKTCQRH